MSSLCIIQLLFACALGDPGPATPASPSAQAVDQIDQIGQGAAQIEAMAIELEEQATAARDLDDPADRAAAIADIRARIDRIKATNATVQQQVKDLQAGLHQAAGDPAPPGSADH